MNSPTRYFLLFLLVFLILFRQYFLGWFEQAEMMCWKWKVKTAVLQDLASSQLVRLTFSEEVWNNLEKPNPTEVIINGRWFDIAYSFNENKNIIVLGIWDDQESQLKAKWRSITKKTFPNREEGQGKNVSVLTSLKFQCILPVLHHSFGKSPIGISMNCGIRKEHYHFIWQILFSPPPEV